MKHPSRFCFPICFALGLALAPSTGWSETKGGIIDDFSEAEREDRQALRGEWKFEDGAARCVADPELYVKFKNHGPILRWPIEMSDGTVECEFQPKGCQRVVLTLNDTGHVFRVVLMDGANEKVRSRVFGWEGPSKTTDHQLLSQEKVPAISDLEGQWVKFKIVFEGDKATVTVGDYSETVTHASAARAKGEFTLSFASGELGMRKVKVVPAGN